MTTTALIIGLAVCVLLLVGVFLLDRPGKAERDRLADKFAERENWD